MLSEACQPDLQMGPVVEGRVHGIHDDVDGSGNPSGCGWYRIVMPFHALADNGWHVSYHADLPTAREMASPVIAGQRMITTEAMRRWRRFRLRSRTVFELDDDIWNVPPVNMQAYPTFSRHDIQDIVETLAATSDVVTVTTEPLAELLRKFNPDVRIIPNCIPGELLSWERPEPQTVKVRGRETRQVRIGWRGGGSHALDVHEISTSVRHVVRRNPHTRLHLVGTDYRPTFGVDADFTKWVPAGPNLAYYRSLLPFDVALAPLSGAEFDRSKSNIAALEPAAFGIPVIASDVEPYRDFVEHGVNGYLVRKRSEWGRYLAELVNDHAARESMGRAAKERAKAWTIESGWKKWAALYKELGACG